MAVTLVRSIERGTVLLGKYRVDSVIGRGGMGHVIKAWHLGLDEEVAIKVLRDDVAMADETIARFIREAQAAAVIIAVGSGRAAARQSGGAGVLRVTPDPAPAGAASPAPGAASPSAPDPR